MRLGGWQRIVILLVTIWIPIGYFWGNSDALHKGDWAMSAYLFCDDHANGNVERENKCSAGFDREYNESIRGHQFIGVITVIFGIISMLLIWLLLWLTLCAFRWVRAGFKTTAPN